jgi:hypothetical protein
MWNNSTIQSACEAGIDIQIQAYFAESQKLRPGNYITACNKGTLLSPSVMNDARTHWNRIYPLFAVVQSTILAIQRQAIRLPGISRVSTVSLLPVWRQVPAHRMKPQTAPLWSV